MTVLAFIDTETTGLDARIHQPYEVSFWCEDDADPVTGWLDHDLTYADQQSLEIGGYWRRGANGAQAGGYLQTLAPRTLAGALVGVTLVGSNPAFDAAMLIRYIGAPVWHHRMIDVAQAAMWVLDTGRPVGLADVRTRLVDRGYDIPEPNHTAEGDVRTTRAVYEALLDTRKPKAACPTIVNHPGSPHSRACGPTNHDHGRACHANCPTCGGKA